MNSIIMKIKYNYLTVGQQSSTRQIITQSKVLSCKKNDFRILQSRSHF